MDWHISCQYCGYSLRPGFKDSWTCPKCGGHLPKRGWFGRGGITHLIFILILILIFVFKKIYIFLMK
jgi:hypothetical protein